MQETEQLISLYHTAFIVFLILTIVFVLLCSMLPLLAVFLTGICLPPQFALTWYGAYPALYRHLEETEGNKIIIVGNSNIAFGSDSALAEQLLREGGLDYSVCNFGLYGSLGTKMMLDIAMSEAEEGDIIILATELAGQSLSTYFSATEAWYALDGDMSLYFSFGKQEKMSLSGAYAEYTAKKLEYFRSGTPAQPSGVYASASFDERGDLKNYDRAYNIMPGGYDANNPLVLDSSLFSDTFVSYLNSSAANLKKRGVRPLCGCTSPNYSSASADNSVSTSDVFSRANERQLFEVTAHKRAISSLIGVIIKSCPEFQGSFL